MFARLLAFKLFAAILLTSCANTSHADPRDLPNDCGIVAAEAYSRLKSSGCWTRIFAFHGMSMQQTGLKPVHHILTAYQYDEESNIMLFDISGSLMIPTQSHELRDIIHALVDAQNGGLIITAARFLSP